MVDLDALIESMKASGEVEGMSDEMLRSALESAGMSEDTITLDISEDGTFTMKMAGFTVGVYRTPEAKAAFEKEKGKA